MAGPSLHDVERTMTLLWTNRKARQKLLGKTARRGGSKPPGKLSPVVLREADQQGVLLYADLLRTGMQDLMLSVYPGCASLIGDDWSEVVDDYFERYPSAHYHLNEAARQLPEYLAGYGKVWCKKYPYLVELADYEWIELELMESDASIEEHPWQEPGSADELERLRPVVNPVLMLRSYSYNIPEIVETLKNEGSSLTDLDPCPTKIAVYRHPETHFCKFLELKPVAAVVVELAIKGPASYAELAAAAVKAALEMDPQEAIVEFLDLIEKLQSLKVFVGSMPIT